MRIEVTTSSQNESYLINKTLAFVSDNLPSEFDENANCTLIEKNRNGDGVIFMSFEVTGELYDKLVISAWLDWKVTTNIYQYPVQEHAIYINNSTKI